MVNKAKHLSNALLIYHPHRDFCENLSPLFGNFCEITVGMEKRVGALCPKFPDLFVKILPPQGMSGAKNWTVHNDNGAVIALFLGDRLLTMWWVGVIGGPKFLKMNFFEKIDQNWGVRKI